MATETISDNARPAAARRTGPIVDNLLDRPINLVHARLDEVRAMLDVLLELTCADDADERLESLGACSLSSLVHAVLSRIDEVIEAVDLIPLRSPCNKAQEVTHV